MLSSTYRTTGLSLSALLASQVSQVSRKRPREYFVTVFDFSSANRSRITEPDRVLPLSSFFGECLSSTSPNAVVTGNAFACQARDVEAVKTMMQESVYCRERIWDLSTASISPLLTVHSSKLRNSEAQSSYSGMLVQETKTRESLSTQPNESSWPTNGQRSYIWPLGLEILEDNKGTGRD